MLIEHLKASCHPLVSDINTCLLLIDKAYHIAQKKKKTFRPAVPRGVAFPTPMFLYYVKLPKGGHVKMMSLSISKTNPPPSLNESHFAEVRLLIKAAEPQGQAVRSQTKDMWHDPQLSPSPLSTFELLYCRAIVIGQQLPDVCATGLTLARKLQQRCFRQLQPDSLRTCGTQRIFRLFQLNVATPEGSSLPEKGEGSFPIQKMQNPWMQHLTWLGSPFNRLLPCSNMSG